MEDSNTTTRFSELDLKTSFSSIFEKSDCFVVSNVNVDFQNERRFTLFISNDLVQFVEKKVSGETYSWGKYWDQDYIFMNDNKYEKETSIPFFGMLETCLYQIIGKNASVFLLNEPSEKDSVVRTYEDLQTMVLQDLTELPFPVTTNLKLETRFQMLQKVSFSLRKAKSLLVNRPVSFSEIAESKDTSAVQLNTSSTLESMGIQMLTGIREEKREETTVSLKILDEKPILFNQLVGPNKEEMISLFSERVQENSMSLSNFLDLIKTLYLSWPKVNSTVHFDLKTCLESRCKNGDGDGLADDIVKSGWTIPQALNSFYQDYSPVIEMLLEKKRLSETEVELVSLWAVHVIRHEETTLVDGQLINKLYVSNHVEPSVKFCPWKKGFIHGFTLSVRKSTMLSRLLNKSINDSFDGLTTNKKKIIEILRAMLFLAEKAQIEELSLIGFESYIFDLDKMSQGHLNNPLTLSGYYKENSMTDFAKYYANEFNRIMTENF
ncbi:hypothetical protein HOH45_09195 [bacterium]|nr:hypothetical protein [bacterium]